MLHTGLMYDTAHPSIVPVFQQEKYTIPYPSSGGVLLLVGHWQMVVMFFFPFRSSQAPKALGTSTVYNPLVLLRHGTYRKLD